MKLNKVLTIVNQVEKTNFITSLDKHCLDAAKTNQTLAKAIENIDGQIKNASCSEITWLFFAVRDLFKTAVKQQILMNSAQIKLLINILSSDGHYIARISLIENLYVKKWNALQALATELQKEIKSSNSSDVTDRTKALTTYHTSMTQSYLNAKPLNRDSKVIDDERDILNALSLQLKLTPDECAAIEHLVDEIPKDGVLEALNIISDMGVVFFSKKRQQVFIPEEIVELLNEIQGKDLADKHSPRLSRTFSDAELTNVLKAHGTKTRSVTRADKMHTIIHAGINAQNLLASDVYLPEDNQKQRKDVLKQLIADLEIDTHILGTTLDERIQLIITSLANATDKEFDSLSASGFKELLKTLEQHFPTIMQVVKSQFKLEKNEILDTNKLSALSITPYDIQHILLGLYVTAWDCLKEVMQDPLYSTFLTTPQTN